MAFLTSSWLDLNFPCTAGSMPSSRCASSMHLLTAPLPVLLPAIASVIRLSVVLRPATMWFRPAAFDTICRAAATASFSLGYAHLELIHWVISPTNPGVGTNQIPAFLFL